jgi:hypothetical protein
MGLETMMSVEMLGTAPLSIQGIPHLWAYLDPGMGSMVLQVLLAGLLSSTFFVKSLTRQIRDALWVRTRKS